MSELAYSEDQKDYNNAKEELARVKARVCIKALSTIGAIPLNKEDVWRIEEALTAALDPF